MLFTCQLQNNFQKSDFKSFLNTSSGNEPVLVSFQVINKVLFKKLKKVRNIIIYIRTTDYPGTTRYIYTLHALHKPTIKRKICQNNCTIKLQWCLKVNNSIASFS